MSVLYSLLVVSFEFFNNNMIWIPKHKQTNGAEWNTKKACVCTGGTACLRVNWLFNNGAEITDYPHGVG